MRMALAALGLMAAAGVAAEPIGRLFWSPAERATIALPGAGASGMSPTAAMASGHVAALAYSAPSYPDSGFARPVAPGSAATAASYPAPAYAPAAYPAPTYPAPVVGSGPGAAALPVSSQDMPGHGYGEAAPAPPPMPAAPVPAGMPMAAPLPVPGAEQPPPAPGLTLDGIVRSSSGRAIVWMNRALLAGAPGPVLGDAGQPPVLLLAPAGGRRILLRPGQRYEMESSDVREAR